MRNAYIGRVSLKKFNSEPSEYIKSSLVLSTLRFTIPALVCSCQSDSFVQEPIAVRSIEIVQSEFPIRNLDIFMFENGEMMTLDSYQRTHEIHGCEVMTASRKGDRLAFLLANGPWDRKDWMSVNSYEALDKFKADLENEIYRYPIMSGKCNLHADGMQTVWVEMMNLSSDVTLKSISCDFNGKSYDNEKITDMKVYLINVNAQCSITSEWGIMPERIINMGGLNEKDMEAMKEPELLFRNCGDLESGDCMETNFRFRCFPNECPDESPGSPFTRLVLEGRINGQIYYWPVDVGRQGNDKQEGKGISRNRRYIYDITITGKGGNSPDIPVSSEVMNLRLEVSEWKEKEEYIIGF